MATLGSSLAANGHLRDRKVLLSTCSFVRPWLRKGAEMSTPSDDIRARFHHATTLLAPVARGSGVVADWRDVWLIATLAVHELEACLISIRRQMP